MVNVTSTYGSGQHAYTMVFFFPGIPTTHPIEHSTHALTTPPIFHYPPIKYHSPFVMKSDRSPPFSELSTKSSCRKLIHVTPARSSSAADLASATFCLQVYICTVTHLKCMVVIAGGLSTGFLTPRQRHFLFRPRPRLLRGVRFGRLWSIGIRSLSITLDRLQNYDGKRVTC